MSNTYVSRYNASLSVSVVCVRKLSLKLRQAVCVCTYDAHTHVSNVLFVHDMVLRVAQYIIRVLY